MNAKLKKKKRRRRKHRTSLAGFCTGWSFTTSSDWCDLSIQFIGGQRVCSGSDLHASAGLSCMAKGQGSGDGGRLWVGCGAMGLPPWAADEEPQDRSGKLAKEVELIIHD